MKTIQYRLYFTHQNSLWLSLLLLISINISAKELIQFDNRDSLKRVCRVKYAEKSVNDLLKLSEDSLGANHEKAFILGELAIEKAILLEDRKGLLFAYQNRGYAAEMYHYYEDALKYYRKALKHTDNLSFHTILYNDMAITYRKAGQYKMCKDYHHLTLDLAKKIEDIEMEESSYHGIGFLYSNIGDYDEALKYYLLSLEIAEQRADLPGIITSMQNISSLYLKSDNQIKAIETIDNAYELVKNVNDTVLIARVLQDYGKTLKEVGRYEEALEKLNQAITIYRSKAHNYLIPRALVHIGDIYIKKKDYAKAETYFKKALQHEKNIEMDVYAHLYNELGQLYLAKDKILKAKTYFLKALAAAQKNDLKRHSLVSYQNLYKIHAHINDYKQALTYLEKSTSLNNEMLSKEKTNRIAELQFKYDVAKSERVLNALKLRQNKLILMGSSLLFILVIGFLVYTNRIKAKSHEKLVVKNEEIQQQNIKLKESNEVLQQFAYVAAHDLREPLRSIGSFVNLLQRKHSSSFNEEAKEYMDFVRSATFRMNNLVTALLKYSTISIQKPSHKTVDMNQIAQEVSHNLKDVISTKHAIVDIEALPKAKMSSLHAAQLFQNLIGNGLKFSELRPHIKVRGWEEEDQVIFSVKDNGIGMKEEYADKVYKLFHQLHKHPKVEGTGIGLTICKNIVDKYDGKIWFKSKENEGTQFFVSFPNVS